MLIGREIRSGKELRAIMAFDGSAIKVITATPAQCRCGRMAAMFVNRDGETLCIDCDLERVKDDEQRSRLIA